MNIDKKRIVINKPKLKHCELCGQDISLYGFTSHLKYNHQITSDDYALIYGEYREQKTIPTRKIEKIVCQLCNKEFSKVGMFCHLRDSHNITPDEYVNKFKEYRPAKLREISYKERLNTIDESEKQQCLICKQDFASGILLGCHVKRDHKITKKEYVIKYVFNGIHPLCKCGCGKKVKLLTYYPYKVDFVIGHGANGIYNPMYGKTHSIETKQKMSLKAIERIEKGIGKTIDTEPELRFKILLNKFNINYIHPYSISFSNRTASIDFYLPDNDLLIEIDGEYWHPDKIQELNFNTISSVISDKQKEVLPNLIRIKSFDLIDYELINTKEELIKKLINTEKLIKLESIKYRQIIINKDYFKYCIEKKGKDYIKSNVWLLLKFIRIFQPTLPYPDLEENLEEIINTISNYGLYRIYNSETKEYSNNILTIGHNYLKHHFHSFWKSRFNGDASPEDAWKNDEIMKKVIEYRIGYNNSNEIFDFSLSQLVKGISAKRLTVSFFKPLLASSIYATLIGNKENPIVLDPCCGFGGRLLGFKSKYPNGKYIGCEPNVETYNELIQLKNQANWKDVEIYNCKFEDFNHNNNINYDLIFTSIPYYDLEIYSNNIKYNSFDEWRNVFIKSIELYSGKNCYINTTIELAEKLNWNNIDSYIVSSRSHFDKQEGPKKEVIIKL